MKCSVITCNHFNCGSIGHHKDCVRYPGSMQNMIDDKNERIKKIEQALEKLVSQCEQVDSWIDFPDSWIDSAYSVIENK
jgi:hypothetical protein